MKKRLLQLLTALAALIHVAGALAEESVTVKGTIVSATPTSVVVPTSQGEMSTAMQDSTLNPDTTEKVTVKGKIVSATASAVVIETEQGAKTYAIEAGTLKPDDMAAGRTVGLTYDPANPALVALHIWYEDPPQAAVAARTEARPQAPARLPKTASPLPLIGLGGLVALAGAVGLRVLRR